jgi:hypothetical protein
MAHLDPAGILLLGDAYAALELAGHSTLRYTGKAGDSKAVGIAHHYTQEHQGRPYVECCLACDTPATPTHHMHQKNIWQNWQPLKWAPLAQLPLAQMGSTCPCSRQLWWRSTSASNVVGGLGGAKAIQHATGEVVGEQEGIMAILGHGCHIAEPLVHCALLAGLLGCTPGGLPGLGTRLVFEVGLSFLLHLGLGIE